MTDAFAAAALAAGSGLLIRHRYLRWGATEDEVAAADLTATRRSRSGQPPLRSGRGWPRSARATAASPAATDWSRALVLRGEVPVGTAPPPYDGTWAFVLRDSSDGTTRLLMRERYGYTRSWSGLILEPVELLSALMSRRMLLGNRDRAERAATATATA